MSYQDKQTKIEKPLKDSDKDPLVYLSDDKTEPTSKPLISTKGKL
jgi:hypothetical protein